MKTRGGGENCYTGRSPRVASVTALTDAHVRAVTDALLLTQGQFQLYIEKKYIVGE